jgi:hypothetical protein
MSLEYTVKYKVGGTSYTLNDVLNLSFFKGRRLIIDPYSPGTATITCRNIAAWPATVKQRQELRIEDSSGNVCFTGYISDVKINYGLKAALDEATILVEGPLRQFGRRNPRNLSLAQANAGTYVADINGQLGVTTMSVTPGSSTSIMSAQTYTGNALDLLNTVAQTEVARIYEYWDIGLGSPATAWYGRNVLTDIPASPYSSVYTFADTANVNQNFLEFDELEFASSSDNYYTRVTVNPLALAAQATNRGAAPYVELDVDSFDYTTTQAKTLSQYLLGVFGSTDAELMSISATYNQQTKVPAYTLYKTTGFLYLMRTYSPAAIRVIFRGTTYETVFEGIEVNATPTDTRITVYVSAQDLNSYLKWGSGKPYNKWGTNKWGF